MIENSDYLLPALCCVFQIQSLKTDGCSEIYEIKEKQKIM